MQSLPLKPTLAEEWNLYSSKKYCLQGSVWPKESSRTLSDLCVFQVLFQALSGHFFPRMHSLIRFGKRSCSSLVAACVSVLMNSRPILARDTHWNSERNNFQLAKMPILLPGISAGARDYLADSVSLCSLCPHLHIRGCLDFFTLLAFRVFESLWAPLGSPFLLKWERQWRGLLLTSASRVSDFPVWFEATYTEWIWSWEMPGLWVKWILWSRKKYVFRQGFHIRSTFRIT